MDRLQLFSARPVPVGSSAGCVRLQRPSSAGCVCLLAFAMPCLLPSSSFAPVLFCISPPPVHCHVRQDRREEVVRTVPLAAATRDCTSGPCTVVCCILHPLPMVIACAICASTETAFAQLMRRCSLHPCKKGEVLDCV